MTHSSSTSASVKPSKAAVRPKPLRRTLLSFGVLAALCFGLLLGAYVVLQTQLGRDALARFVENQLSDGETAVVLGTLNGNPLREFVLHDIRVSDPLGSWLVIDKATVVWHPTQLLRGRLRIARVTLEEIAVARQPVSSDDASTLDIDALVPPVQITLDDVAAERIVLAESVLGEAMALGATGTSAIDHNGRLEIQILVTRLDRSEDYAKLGVTFDAGHDELSVEADLHSPEGGLLPRLLGLPGLPEVSFNVSGGGPLGTWQARWRASAAGLAKTHGTAAVRFAEQTRIELHGQLHAEPTAPQGLVQLAQPALELDTDISLQATSTLVVHRATLTNALGEASLHGRVTRENIALDMSLALKDQGTERLAELLAPLGIEHTELGARVTGNLAQPSLDLILTAERLTTPDKLSIDRLTAALSLAQLWGTERTQPRFTGHGMLEGLHADDIRLQPLLDEPIAWTMRGAFVLDDTRVQLEHVTANTESWRMSATGRVPYDGPGAVDMGIELQLLDLGRLRELANLPLKGNAEATVRLQSAPDSPHTTATITAQIRDLVTGDDILGSLLGEQVTLDAAIARDAEGVVSATDIMLRTDTAALSGAARFPADLSTVDATYALNLRRLDTFSPWLDKAVSGSATAEGNLSGPSANPNTSTTILLDELAVDGLRVGSVAVELMLEHLLQATGIVDITLVDTAKGPTNIHARVDLTPDSRLRLTDLNATAVHTELSGAVSAHLATGLVEGQLTGQLKDLDAWSTLAGRRLSGHTALEATLSSQSGRQDLTLALDGGEIAIELDEVTLEIQALSVESTLNDVLQTPRGTISLSAVRAHAAGLALERMSADLEVEGPDIDVKRLQAEGVLDEPFTVDLTGSVTFQALDAYRFSLERLDARVLDTPIALDRPLSVSIGPRGIVVEELRLAVADGRVEASARVEDERVNAKLELEALPLSLTGLALPRLSMDGKVSGHLTLDGPRANPMGSVELELTGLRDTQSVIAQAPALSGTVTGEWRDQRLRLEGDLTGLADTTLTWQGELPLRMRTQTLGIDVPADAPIAGNAQWSGDVAPLWQLLSDSEDSFTGTGELGLAVDGTLGAPHVRGEVTLANGRYESALTGTVLQQITIVAKGDNDRLVLSEAHASAGASGTVTARGMLMLDVAKDFPVDLGLELDSAVLIQRDDLTATASGQLALKGDFGKAELSGQIVTERVDALIGGNTLPPQVVELEVVEINQDDASTPVATQTSAKGPEFIHLALDIDLPGKVFVRGLGVDSEWRGGLRVRGTADKPIVKGELRPVRGRYSFAGKVFELENGSVRFTGSSPIDPLLDLPAEYKASSITAIIAITGRASNPVVTLSSRPPMPESGIAARVIFGTEQSNLTPLQSVQLADAVAALTTGGVGVLERARRSVGVDVIRVGNDDDNDGDPKVSVGKYVTDRVYVEVEQGTNQDSTGGAVEVEVLNNISVNGGMTRDGNNKFGVKWKWDY